MMEMLTVRLNIKKSLNTFRKFRRNLSLKVISSIVPVISTPGLMMSKKKISLTQVSKLSVVLEAANYLVDKSKELL
jgi:hypothetical protein